MQRIQMPRRVVIRRFTHGRSGGTVDPTIVASFRRRGDVDVVELYDRFFRLGDSRDVLSGRHGYRFQTQVLLHELLHALDEHSAHDPFQKAVGFVQAGSRVRFTVSTTEEVAALSQWEAIIPRLERTEAYVEERRLNRRLAMDQRPIRIPTMDCIRGPAEAFAEIGSHLILDDHAAKYLPPSVTDYFAREVGYSSPRRRSSEGRAVSSSRMNARHRRRMTGIAAAFIVAATMLLASPSGGARAAAQHSAAFDALFDRYLKGDADAAVAEFARWPSAKVDAESGLVTVDPSTKAALALFHIETGLEETVLQEPISASWHQPPQRTARGIRAALSQIPSTHPGTRERGNARLSNRSTPHSQRTGNSRPQPSGPSVGTANGGLAETHGIDPIRSWSSQWGPPLPGGRSRRSMRAPSR